jgi:MFS transporter, DHA2 family, methylenomycin A resistance protein
MSRRAASLVLAFALLDLTAVGVQLPTLRADLGSSPSGGQWILNAWLLTLAVALPLARAARADRRTLLAAGAVAMAAGAALCATADSTATLVVGRAIEGAGLGVLLAPVTTAAAWLPLAALALGPIVGGGLAEKNWWHLYFAASALAAVVLAAAAWRDAEPGEARQELDRSTSAVLGALVVLTLLLVQGEPWGLPRFLAYLVGYMAVLTLGARWVASLRAAAAAAGGALASICFLMPQYLELAHLIHPVRSGIWVSAATIPAVAGIGLAWRARGRVPRPVLLAAGALVASAGAVVLYLLQEDSGEALFGAGLVLTGGGFGLAAAAGEDDRVGELLPSFAIGAAITLAASGAMFQYTQADQRAAAESFQHSLSRGVADAALMLLILAVTLLAGVLLPRRASSAARPAAES